MNKELNKVLSVIVERLSKEEIKSFKIGKTANPDERFTSEDYDHFHYASIIAHCNDSAIITQAEEDLISYFQKHKSLKDKCCNEQLGGGSPDATYLYIVAGREDADPYAALLDKDALMDEEFMIIELK